MLAVTAIGCAALAAPTRAAAARAAAAPAAPSGKQVKTEEQLQSVRAEIARIRERVNRDQIESDHMESDLRSAELALGTTREALDQLRRDRAVRAEERAALLACKREREAALARERTDLAAQLRAAYLIGREEPLKLLLNQQDPALASRMWVYYGYFGRARAAQLARITSNLHELDALDRELQSEDQHLASLEADRTEELARLEQARARRAAALASLRAQSRTRTQALARLQRQQTGLERLLQELSRAVASLPLDLHSAFGRLRGKLAWPVSGQLAARFGQVRAGAVRWDGVLIDTERGAPVRAVSAGRVIFADWLPGLGLLSIIDHGDGYLSLYGHNEHLYKGVGEQVAAGDVIATAGDSGGTERPQLYFEIRKAGHPLDPRPWFSAPEPAAHG
jgi:murein hydrolase activator